MNHGSCVRRMNIEPITYTMKYGWIHDGYEWTLICIGVTAIRILRSSTEERSAHPADQKRKRKKNKRRGHQKPAPDLHVACWRPQALVRGEISPRRAHQLCFWTRWRAAEWSEPRRTCWHRTGTDSAVAAVAAAAPAGACNEF